MTCSKRLNVFILSRVCFPGGSYLFVTQHWFIFWPSRGGCCSLSHNSGANILNKVTILNLWTKTDLSISMARFLSPTDLLNQISGSEFLCCVLYSHLHRSHASDAEGARRPAAAWVADRGLGLQLAHANHVDYCDYRPFPPPCVTLQLTDLDLTGSPGCHRRSIFLFPSVQSPHHPPLYPKIPLLLSFLHSSTVSPWGNLGTVSSSHSQASHNQEVY